MNVNKGIIVRVKPNAGQRHLLDRHFGHNRFLWNYFLGKRREDYQRDKTSSNYYLDAAELTKLKQQAEYAWLYEASINSQQRTLKNLDDAYKRFFKGHARFPRFKSKRHEQSFTLAGSIKVKGNRLIFPKFQEGLKFNRKLPAYTKINNVTIRRAASGKYYAALSVEAEVEAKPMTGKAVGVDMGLIDFAVLSNGKRFKNPRNFKQGQQQLKEAQQNLSRKKKGSKRRDRQRIKVARIQEKIANSRKDFHHKASAYLVNTFDTIAVESLAVKNMLRNHCLAKAIADAGWGMFLDKTAYKAMWYGKTLLKAERFYPSSKACHCCGHINQSLRLDQREWDCPACHAHHDRDQNASINILGECLRSARQSSITDAEGLSACA